LTGSPGTAAAGDSAGLASARSNIDAYGLSFDASASTASAGAM